MIEQKGLVIIMFEDNIKYELIPYDDFVGSEEFDFDKTIPITVD